VTIGSLGELRFYKFRKELCESQNLYLKINVGTLAPYYEVEGIDQSIKTINENSQIAPLQGNKTKYKNLQKDYETLLLYINPDEKKAKEEYRQFLIRFLHYSSTLSLYPNFP